MTSLVLIDVTQEDIDKGCRESTQNCMVYLACKRVLKMDSKLYVAPSGLHEFIHLQTITLAKFPEWVRQTILSWDSGYYTKPFQWFQEVPSELVETPKELVAASPVSTLSQAHMEKI